jgi:pantoate--beta-alanine ligase
MQIYHFGKDLQNRLNLLKTAGNKIGFVPTMGALHEGHLSLVQLARVSCSHVVVSIFVNPTQFNDISDFEKYPSTISKDIRMLNDAGCDILFYPDVHEMYPLGTKQKDHYPLGYLEEILEGKYRPGHFQGVCQVVDRLLTLVNPDFLFLGEKDYQQCMVISKLLELTNRTPNTILITGSTMREKDGLAMSSRNARLTDTQRKKAATIYQCMNEVKKNIGIHAISALKEKAVSTLEHEGFQVDYLEIADEKTLLPVSDINRSEKIRVLIAAKIGSVRLIDNTPLLS